MVHLYLDNCYDEKAIAQMQSTDGDSINLTDWISQTEFDTVRTMFDTIKWPEHGSTSKYAGASYNDPLGKPIQEIFESKLHDTIGDHQLDFFAFQEAINPWKIHADLRWYSDRVPHKVVLVPLDVISDSDDWADTYSIAFNQRNYLRKPAGRGDRVGNVDQDSWVRPFEDQQVEGCASSHAIDLDTWKRYFSHVPYEHLEGLEINNIFRWRARDAVVWDQSQLHCADNFLANNIATKYSLIFFTNQIA